MARVLLVCARDGNAELYKSAIKQAVSFMAPSNIFPRAPFAKGAQGVSANIVNPPRDVVTSDNAICLGRLSGHQVDWHEIGAPAPDGSYALLRWREDFVELLSDAAGSRSLWYAQTDDVFVASSSIQAIVHILGSFEFDRQAIAWVLATGALGPNTSWDTRIKRLPLDSVLRLDRTSWSVTSRTNPVRFSPAKDGDGVDRLQSALDHSLSSTAPPSEGSLLTVSGGYDSRYLLLKLKDFSAIRYVTWGMKEALSHPQNDAAVASALASKVGVTHEYLPIEAANLSISEVLARFTDQSEGAVDHLSGYADGFSIWASLFEGGATTYIRGDEGFGWNHAVSVDQSRRDLGLAFVSDYFTPEQMRNFSLADAALPSDYAQKPGETLETWRDRLYHIYRLPVILAALNEVKAGYLDVINPLLGREVLQAVRTLPDEQRTEKAAFKKVVERISPAVPYAREGANIRMDDLLGSSSFLEAVKAELIGAPDALLAPELKAHILSRLERKPEAKPSIKSSLKRMARRLLPASFKAKMRASRYRAVRPMAPEVLAFRAYTIGRMHRLLTDQAGDRSSGGDQSTSV